LAAFLESPIASRERDKREEPPMFKARGILAALVAPSLRPSKSSDATAAQGTIF
jgi:hypothetical protein